MKVGDKVICIDDSFPLIDVLKHFDYWIKKGNEYTIRGIRQWYGEDSLLLEGLKNQPMYNPEIFGHCEPGYNKKRFILKPKQDELLNEFTEEERTLTT